MTPQRGPLRFSLRELRIPLHPVEGWGDVTARAEGAVREGSQGVAAGGVGPT